jgi:cell division protease FtsH
MKRTLHALLIIGSSLTLPSQLDALRFPFPISPGTELIGEAIDSIINAQRKSRDPKFRGHDIIARHRNLQQKNTTTFADVQGLPDDVIKEMREVATDMENNEAYRNAGATPPSGVLLVGPPGTGKTLLARAVAGETKSNFIACSGSELISTKYAGTGSANVRDLFERARKNAPTIIFIDEIDALAFDRNAQNDGSAVSVDYRATLDEFLNQFDGLNRNSKITIIGATNSLKTIDPALLRPGRFSRIIEVPLPTFEGRKEILLHYLKKLPNTPPLSQEDISSLAKGMPNFSGAEIKDVVNEAAILAARDKQATITLRHLNDAIERRSLGIKSNRNQSKEDLQRTAYHEAGHALLRLVCNEEVHRLSITNRSHTDGVTMLGEAEYKVKTESKLRAYIMGLQAGHIAEELVFKEPSAGSSDDLRRASTLATYMVKELGMSKDASLRGIAYTEGMTQEPWNKAVQDLLRSCAQETLQILKMYRKILDLLAHRLLEKEVLEAKEILAIYNANRSLPQQ